MKEQRVAQARLRLLALILPCAVAVLGVVCGFLPLWTLLPRSPKPALPDAKTILSHAEVLKERRPLKESQCCNSIKRTFEMKKAKFKKKLKEKRAYVNHAAQRVPCSRD